MKSFRREVWSYAILLIILFCIASIAVWQTITYFQEFTFSPEDMTFPIVMWSLTLGFMLIAGAYGLWAIKFSAQAESRRRIGRFVDAMDYFSDGLLVVDRNGQITGSNPAAEKITCTTVEKEKSLLSVCPSLSDQDVNILLHSNEPIEVERTAMMSGSPKTLRYRSQPSEDLTLIEISDVTTLNTERLHNRQKARLQLVGHLARGMAHDFNRLLCEISAHASLVKRVPPGSPEMNHSLEELGKNVEKGMTLAGHLLGLAQPDLAAQFTDSLGFYVNRTAELLRGSLPHGWQVDISIHEEFPTVGLTGIQIEQVVFNLGILAADASKTPGIMKIAVMKPHQNYLDGVKKELAAIIMVTASGSDMSAIASQSATERTYGDSGIILSIVRSIIEEADGSLECLTAVDGSTVYRVGIPFGNLPVTSKDSSAELADELKTYIAQWSILIAGSTKETGMLQQHLHSINAKIETVDNVMSLLSRIEEDRDLDVMVISKQILGQETKGLLKAILKLRPSAGIVVLCENPNIESEGISNEVVFESVRSNPNKILSALLEARSLTASRAHR
ncbi:MAG: hypothetical protein PHR77_08960 [Kiritimatiellae bacterium]|nr:hypothetical protein [Kiritimatiellia bacterium]MDD5522871.1 hypothetical protein [Kiritimatiellia bacterium]